MIADNMRLIELELFARGYSSVRQPRVSLFNLTFGRSLPMLPGLLLTLFRTYTFLIHGHMLTASFRPVAWINILSQFTLHQRERGKAAALKVTLAEMGFDDPWALHIIWLWSLEAWSCHWARTKKEVQLCNGCHRLLWVCLSIVPGTVIVAPPHVCNALYPRHPFGGRCKPMASHAARCWIGKVCAVGCNPYTYKMYKSQNQTRVGLWRENFGMLDKRESAWTAWMSNCGSSHRAARKAKNIIIQTAK